MINLVDEFYLDADDRQFFLVEWDGKMVYNKMMKKDVPQYGRTLYYTKFENVLEKLSLILQRRGIEKSTTLVEVGEEFAKTRKIIEELAKQMNPTYKDAYGTPL